MKNKGVLQLIDALDIGGAERLAVNLANELVKEVPTFFCVTRRTGELKNALDNHINFICLHKKRRIDFSALMRLKRFVNANNIGVVHAHSTSYFFAAIFKIISWKTKIIWHDHNGNRLNTIGLKKWILKVSSLFFSAIIAVNKDLQAWSKKHLFCNQVDYIPNFVAIPIENQVTKLHGSDGKRIVCLANLRKEKDHINLIKAFHLVKNKEDWSLHLIGEDKNDEYSKEIKSLIQQYNLDSQVYIYGARKDVFAIMKQATIGILSSRSEGLPMSLLEYGLANLGIITTDVGECKNVIGDYGLCVEKENSEALAEAIALYMNNESLRNNAAINFHQKVRSKFSKDAVIKEYLKLYNLSA